MPTLDRRGFLRSVGALGLTLSARPFLTGRPARAAEGFQGPYFIYVHAGGGWDPTLLCDPKGRVSESDVDPVNRYFVDEIAEVGPFRVAPVDGHVAFFERVRDRLLVFNGLDAQTNSHETGARYAASGMMDAGAPALAALVAARAEPRPSLAYLSHGGYDLTTGLVGSTRLPDTSSILEVAYPDRLVVSDPSRRVFPEEIQARIAQARNDRLARLAAAEPLPRVKRSMELLAESRTGDNDLRRLAEILPDNANEGGGLVQQARITMSCFKAGVAVAASMQQGGFDTHGNHDASHTPRMQSFVAGLMAILDEAERHDLADRVVIVVGSDFARTPWYNDGNGKDHWSVSSMMMMGPGIRGGRVIGATDERQVPIGVNPTTLAVEEGGMRVTYAHVHSSLRALANLHGWEPADRFDVGETLPLFT